ncbi:MAG: ABC-F family ATP-binding cassette domain-containing protein, partial [Planctomycetaceae bacterium]|nr:ABC-F family ATP-binding cassette domain-containing protein [Planctomycetaceae bacterium]
MSQQYIFTIEHLTRIYDETAVLEDIWLAFFPGAKIGVIGNNGSGKSTLLRIMAGEDKDFMGEARPAKGIKIGYFSQEPRLDPNKTVQECIDEAVAEPRSILDRYNEVNMAFADASPEEMDKLLEEQQKLQDQIDHANLWELDRTLEIACDAMRLPPMDAKVEYLSGGEKRRVALCQLLLGNPDLLLLDEPTNHLDLGKIVLLERWLTTVARAVPAVIASHDRDFLDAVTNRTLFLRPGASRYFPLAYSAARAELDREDETLAAQTERDLKEATKLRKQAAKLTNIGINSGSDLLTLKTKQLRERAERLEDLARPAHQEHSAGTIRLANRSTHAGVLVTLDNADVTTPDGTLLFRTGQLWIRQGDRIVLLGRNGTGKTRLVKMVRSAIAEPAGAIESVKATPSLVLGYGDQALSDLADGDTPLAAVTRRFELGEQRARSLLAGAGIGLNMQGNAIGRLSGGQKARLSMLVLRLTAPNFYLLDEPTNHLDIEGQEALEAELLEREASCLIVS